ncbi:MAG: hypothetical protein ABH852_06490, partial [Methanobacteriota archaeon]
VGIALNGELYIEYVRKSDDEVKKAMERVRRETGLPTIDAVRFGAAEIFDALLTRFKEAKKL